MSDPVSVQNDYAMYRLERAKEDLDAAKLLFDSGKYRIANNRAYYCIFHTLRAVLAFDKYDSRKHSGVIAEFRKKYIKTGIFPVKISKMIGSAFINRNASDYDDMFVASKLETEEQIDNAEYIYHLVYEYISRLTDQKD